MTVPAFMLAKGGATVVAAGRREAEGKALETELRALGAQAAFIKTDVRREDEVRHLVDETIARFGRLNVAVNSAGTEGKPGQIVEQTADTYAATFDTTVLGTLLSMKHELRAMADQGSGSIVNITSAYGHKAAAGATAYVSSKFAVEGMTKCVALEQGNSGIRVNAVAPGPTDTAMLDRFTGTAEVNDALVATVPLRRRGTTEELANAIVFISSPEASYISGTVFEVDGGMSAT